MSPRSRSAIRPGCACSLRPREGVGNAGCQRTRSRACSVDSTRVSHHGYAEHPAFPHATVLTVYSRTLPGDRLSCHRRRRKNSADLTPAPRRRDHTALPSASTRLVRPGIGVHRIPPRGRDDRVSPLIRDGTAGVIDLIWVFGKSEYFCKRGWTGFADLPVGRDFARWRAPRSLPEHPRHDGFVTGRRGRITG